MPAKRFGRPAEIARAAVFLASDESAFAIGAAVFLASDESAFAIGSELVIDGGFTGV